MSINLARAYVKGENDEKAVFCRKIRLFYRLYFATQSYIALRQLYLPLASDIAHYARSCGYNLDRNSPKVNITSVGHITHGVNITHASEYNCNPQLRMQIGRICSTANHGTLNQLTSVIDIELYSNKNKKK